MAETEPTPEMPPPEAVSLEALSDAFAQAMRRTTSAPEVSGDDAPHEDHETEAVDPSPATSESTAGPEAATVAISPLSILEAILFVGSPGNEPLSAREAAAVMRNVDPSEVASLVGELNRRYAADGCPYHIVHDGRGYRMTLREEFDAIRQRFFGKIREARLTQSAVDTLAIVAYRQPITAKEVSELRGKPSGGILSQLVRRNLLTVEKSEQRGRPAVYRTTDRFLELMGIDSLDELPQIDSDEPESDDVGPKQVET
ncbi:SMC-Scp complex subunit ScpB [Thermostilla marina]